MSLRTARGWSQRQAADIARRQELSALTRQVLLRLERGQTKNPDPDVFQAVAWQDVPKAAPLNRWLKDHTGIDLRVYDLRHSYATALARRGTRLDVIASLLGHSTLELSKRYVLAAVTPDAAAATARLAERLARPKRARFAK